ncbi:AbrB family transcriptional regulator [Cribrihabitans pelagius]|uniref:AbrB family transcriptional regulator n=1 Tax=Cribrihabitans pelagius TaxID=1765746 RepID=UPI003B5D04D4
MRRDFALTALLALAGAALGHLSGLPLGELLGAAGLTFGAGRLGLPLRTPNAAIVLIQLILGASVGALLNPELLAGITRPMVLAGLLVCMSAQLAAGYGWLRRVEKWSPAESLLGAVPGAMAAVMVLTGDEGKASAKIVFAHMVRTVALLVAVFVIAGPRGSGAAAGIPAAGAGAYLMLLAIAAAGYGAGRLLERCAMPAPYMITGLMLAAAANLSGLIAPVSVPGPLVLLAMALLGGLIGIRLKEITLRDVVSYLRAGLIVTTITFSLTAALAWLFSALSGQAFLVLFMSWVPGGVEVMVATALVLGLEPAFVMLNHVLRMSILHAAPVFLRRDMFRNPSAPAAARQPQPSKTKGSHV